MQDLSVQEWKERTTADDDAVILDVRTQVELEEGTIPDYIHHDIHDAPGFMSALDKLDKSKNYYVYCRSGGRSAQACQIMDQLGFNETYNLATGFSGYNHD